MSSTVAGWPGYAKPAVTLLNAGVVYVGTTPVAMGATEGGTSFDPGIETRHVPFDGMTTEVAGQHRRITYNSVITGRWKDISAAAIMRLEPGSTSDGSTGTNTITPIKAHQTFVQGDYLRDVTFVGLCSDGKTRRVYAEYGYVERYNLATTDKAEGLFDLTIKLVLPPDTDGADLNNPPYVWEEVDAA